MAEFTDAPLVLLSGEPTYHDIFEAKHVTTYLEDYIDSHVFDGKILRDRIIFNFSVASIEKKNDTWTVYRESNGESPSAKVKAKRLMIASGMTSQPNMPSLPKGAEFKAALCIK